MLGLVLAPTSAATPPHEKPEEASGASVASASANDREVVHSDNIKQLANLPKQAPFDNVDAYGTDIAFKGDHAYVGNYDGFVVYDIKNPRKPSIVSQVACPGGQGDVSISGDLLFVSTDYPRSNDTCQSEEATASDPDAWEGIKVFDVSDPAKPRYVSAVPTDCGSHTHTLVPDKAGESVYLYISSYSPSEEFPNCQPPHDKISIVEVPLENPAEPKLIDAPVLFPDGGNPGGEDGSRETTGCHDITAFPEKDLAAGACMGDGVLLDISDREKPRVINQVRDDENFAFWHSATFNNTGDKVVFTDELGGGGAATCNTEVGSKRGANGVYNINGSGDNAQLQFQSYYKIPRHQADSENCVAHNGSLIPVEGRDIMVQAWYQGGVSVWDFTDSANPHEIGYFDRSPFSEDLRIAGSWSAYYYNGHIYSSGIQEGLDVLDIRDPRTAPAKKVRYEEFNPQTQPVYGR
ncbi:LVIVD repeat-containing protein [Parasphingorhabdus pacifica]